MLSRGDRLLDSIHTSRLRAADGSKGGANPLKAKVITRHEVGQGKYHVRRHGRAALPQIANPEGPRVIWRSGLLGTLA